KVGTKLRFATVVFKPQAFLQPDVARQSLHHQLVLLAFAQDEGRSNVDFHRISRLNSMAVAISSLPKVVATIFPGSSMRRSSRRKRKGSPSIVLAARWAASIHSRLWVVAKSCTS